MKIKNLVLGIMAVVGGSAFWGSNALATNWYVRDGGGNAAQCTGTTNAVYPGSGSAQNCAFNNPRYALGWDSDNPQAGTISGGDTVYIDGDSDTNPGTQAQYLIGYDNTGANTTPDCSSSWPYDCTLANIPAGLSASQPTSIIGTGTHKPQLWGNERVWQVLSASNNYITLQWLEITDHDACAYNDPVDGCNYGGPYPYGAWSEDGIIIGGTGLTLTDVYVHGLGRYGINVADGTSSMGSATFTRLWVIGNGYGGFTTGLNNSLTGTWTFNQPIIEWNGCAEAYPMTNAGVDNPANYSQCFGQNSGGYGDGLAFGPEGNLNAGNWTIIGPGSISFNTQDGLDTLHGNGNGTISVDKMRFEGNAGQQVKANGNNFYLTNSIVVGDCGWWYQAPQSYSGFANGDICRANGDAILFNVTNGSTTNIFNNTILSNGSIVAESTDGESTGCNSATSVNFKNNIVYGGYWWGDDTTFNTSGGNSLTDYIYNDGNNGDGAGTCGNITWNEDYNVVYNTKNNNQGCSGAHDKCGINPEFTGTIPMGAPGGAADTYYQGNSAETLFSLASGSAAITTGVTGLAYWNNGNDYHNVARTNPPSMGGLEAKSCALNANGCFYNSDCCAGSCSNFTCGTANAAPQPVVAITSPASGSNFSAGSNVTITATASEAGGTITNISIYNGAVLLGSSSSSPYNYVLTNPVAGTYTLTAQATDANGVSVSSSQVTVTIAAQSIIQSLPTVNITSPASGSSFTAGSNVTVTTAASETNGTISNIALYNGSGILLGSSTVSPYSFVDSDMLAGTYTFYAVATDVNGISTTSNDVTLTVTPAASSPVVAITSPANASSFIAGSTSTITASASETNGSIASVAFYYNGTNLLGTSTASPYNFVVTDMPAGGYTLTAVATDAKGVSVTSSPVSVTVAAAAVAPSAPVVAMTSPANASSFTAGSSITMTASASETNGTISKVAFYNGSTLLGTDSSSPYSFTWSNVAAGSYTLKAVATDANSVSVTSSPVTVTVSAPLSSPPVVAITSPVSGSSFTAGTNATITASASETNGSIASVAFYYNGTNLLGTSTASPYNFVVTNMPAGSYTLTAVATDAKGVSVTSSPVAVTVTAVSVTVPAPVVAITSPSSGSSITAGSNVTITATASQTNGTISQVAFYNGSILLGTVKSSPYSYMWRNVSGGSYNLTAKATGSNGLSATCQPVTITVVSLIKKLLIR